MSDSKDNRYSYTGSTERGASNYNRDESSSGSARDPRKLDDADEVSLDPETVRRLNNVRKDIWAGGAKGLGYGLLLGYACYHCAGYIPQLRRVRSKNHLVLSVLLGGSLGSFLGATVSGKNAVQHIGDIFQINARSASAYRNQMSDNQRRVVESMDASFESRRAAIERGKNSNGSINSNSSYGTDGGAASRRDS